MAYRRKQQLGKISTAKEEEAPPPPQPPDESSSSAAACSLVAKAIRDSSAYRDYSLSAAYSPGSSPLRSSAGPSPLEVNSFQYTSMRNFDGPKQGFWGILARKAKNMVDDENVGHPHEPVRGSGIRRSNTWGRDELHSKFEMPGSPQNTDDPALQKRFGAFASSLNSIGGRIGNAIEEGLTAVENRTADIIQETRKLQIRRTVSSVPREQDGIRQSVMQPKTQTGMDTQLKASRDVAMAMAAKAKLLLRELKTVKADLAFAKKRCAQLEEENKLLREGHQKGDHTDDDDMIRLQLETLLAEKGRLAQDNSVLARENRFLREIVEYHQLTMQDVVYLDENNEEMTEVYPTNKGHIDINLQSLSVSPVPYSPTSKFSPGFNLAAGSEGLFSPASSSRMKGTPKNLSRLDSFSDTLDEPNINSNAKGKDDTRLGVEVHPTNKGPMDINLQSLSVSPVPYSPTSKFSPASSSRMKGTPQNLSRLDSFSDTLDEPNISSNAKGKDDTHLGVEVYPTNKGPMDINLQSLSVSPVPYSPTSKFSPASSSRMKGTPQNLSRLDSFSDTLDEPNVNSNTKGTDDTLPGVEVSNEADLERH